MLTKFETKSNRVKGLAFHPKRPWILASLHNGSIQLWDYRMGTLIDRFDEHEGPVRGVHFHPTQPLFVSGGDDYKIKIWNYKLRRCIFTLTGHLDYIRTVYFHHESPWIVSASDDQTIRVWNWQNRSCLSILTGHNHYVMCAQFHPLEDLVVSASLDQTIRVWDISSLRQKSAGPGSRPGDIPNRDIMSQVRGRIPAAVNADLFGTGDAIVKYLLEGHTRGVNWVSFHPTLPLIISGADDRQVKLWRMSEMNAWEVDTFRGHLNNVSCALFHPRQELVISNAEDKTIRVWDLNRRTCLHTFRRENDRFWVLAVHPTVNLIAAGHDTGMIVFKLQRERPPYAVSDGSLFFVKDNYIRSMSFDTARDMPLLLIRQQQQSGMGSIYGGGLGDMYGSSDANGLSGQQAPARSMTYNQHENCVLLNFAADGGSYELYFLPKSGSTGDTVATPRKGEGISACFVGRNRMAILDRTRTQIYIKDLHNEVTKTLPCLLPGADALFPAGTGFVLLKNEEKVVLMDLQQKRVLAEIAAMNVKYVVWNDDMSRVVLLGKHSLVIATRRLEHLATVHETVRVKSAAWDESGVIIYTTLNHLKYCLPNGDNGIVNTLKDPVYITRVRGPGVCYIDRNGNPGIFAIDFTEYAFKLLLLRKRYDDVRKMIAENRLCGKAIIAYLQRKGFPEVALHFVRDERTRFNLAIDSGAIDIAKQAATQLDEPQVWSTLAATALKLGDIDVVEQCYQRTKDLERLAFLYVLLGDHEKLRKMSGIAEARRNMMAKFQICLYLGDVEGVLSVLLSCGQVAMAKIMAKAHGLEETLKEMGVGDVDDVETVEGKFMPRPLPLSSEQNWPTLRVSRGLFSRDPGAEQFEEPTGDYYEDAAAFEASEREREADDDWGAEDRRRAAADKSTPAMADPFAVGLDEDKGADVGGDDDGWGDDLDIDFGGGEAAPAQKEENADDDFGEMATDQRAQPKEYYVPPPQGPGVGVRWTRSAKLVGELVAGGAFQEAMKLLSRQIGAKSFDCFKEPFRTVYIGCRGAIPGLPNTTSAIEYFGRGPESPAIAITLTSIRDEVAAAQSSFAERKFTDAARIMRNAVASIPLLVVSGPSEEEEVKKLLSTCREYLLALLVESAQGKAKEAGDPGREVQLAGLFTRCDLMPSHKVLALRAAMRVAFDTKNFILASGFARRIVDASSKPPPQAMKMIQYCDQNNTNANEVDYDDRRDFVVEASNLTPLYAGQARSHCSYCNAVYAQSADGSCCSVCQIGTVGFSAEGLRVKAS
mmetsp:Transcript_1588/g.4763  ORF Transcript_1588/g.4763 Transcript_1588/m.4763 type:complete len:1272 (-) Transcript_1588:142-3957(-)|eukprot:CAMPEP_0198731772 /NCGR_PEP_ID=MMETSP1475-20131203/32070_1 /TAXON_ID= ORGANISM="Unidentified sp., Strain CCMP1999" /NCGR_SAMPLE_ID=MMETSP1475 /ASSEMBLY_ACC=CAM_ASM_001111 /LENGTH=1271 /DNA_ID=CAMNT_0044494777 /DNA_START=106 /DNA_END=3921 /DNA_ORIENTATION=+